MAAITPARGTDTYIVPKPLQYYELPLLCVRGTFPYPSYSTTQSEPSAPRYPRGDSRYLPIIFLLFGLTALTPFRTSPAGVPQYTDCNLLSSVLSGPENKTVSRYSSSADKADSNKTGS